MLTDRPHTVELKVSALTGREVVAIDGREVANALNWSLSNTHALQLGDQRGELSIKAGFPTPRVTLTVGGREVPPVSTAGTVRSSTPTPVWVYPFAGLCFAIPIVTLGGALPMGLGFGAGAACLGIARKEEHEMALGVRVAACAAITIAAWGVLVALLLAVARSRAG